MRKITKTMMVIFHEILSSGGNVEPQPIKKIILKVKRVVKGSSCKDINNALNRGAELGMFIKSVRGDLAWIPSDVYGAVCNRSTDNIYTQESAVRWKQNPNAKCQGCQKSKCRCRINCNCPIQCPFCHVSKAKREKIMKGNLSKLASWLKKCVGYDSNCVLIPELLETFKKYTTRC